MPQIEASATSLIPAAPARVYGILADYREGHPAILPPEFFRDFRVVQGGQGAGTLITFGVRSFGRIQRFRAAVAEPEPGRRLTETDVESGTTTSFTVEPADEGRGARVTIATHHRRDGIAGWIERWLAPRFLCRVYAAELALLAQRATG
ncbi:MAG TPA: SRPBCC family protein [Gemmatimonadales bacterium]|nr:SRPBCC family protein [Gemmatimonadales bacterium]